MANRRMLAKSISCSKQVNHLSSDFVRLLFTWTIPHLDDFGKTNGDSEVLKATVMPMLNNTTIKDIEKGLEELKKVGLIEWYEVLGQWVVRYPNFES